MHINPRNIPFALSLLPFLTAGICLPAILQDWHRGHLSHGDALTLVIGPVIVVVWYWIILRSVESKRRAGKQTLLGRALSSWLWAPPVVFIVALACGLAVLFA